MKHNSLYYNAIQFFFNKINKIQTLKAKKLKFKSYKCVYQGLRNAIFFTILKF